MKTNLIPFHFMVAFLFAVILVTGCTSTKVVNSWKAPDAQIEQGEFKKVLVAVLSVNEASRRKAEEMVSSYKSFFVPSYQVLGTQEIAMDTANTKPVIKRQGFDGVLIFRLMEKDKSQTWVPGNSVSMNYWDYHYGYYSAYYDPGYVREDVNYLIECNLYSLKDKELLWTGITSTMNPVDLEQTVNEVVATVYRQMQEDGIFSENNPNPTP